MKQLSKLLLTSRPVSWLNTAYPFAAGYLVSGGGFDVTFWVGTLYFLIPYNLLMYGVNDIFDYESDIRNPRKGGIEGAKGQKALHPAIWRGVLLTNLPCLAWLLATGTPITNAVLAGVIFFVIAYSVKYLRFKELPILDSITSSLHFVGPLVFALTLTNSIGATLPYVIAFFLWGMASHAFGAVQDIKPDREGGLASIATVFGAKITVGLAVMLYLCSCLIVAFQGHLPLVVAVAGSAYVVNTALFLWVTDDTSEATNKGWRRFIWLNYLVGFVLTMTLIDFYIIVC